MKYAFVSPHVGFFRHYDQIVRKLSSQGHQVILNFGNDPTNKFPDRALKAYLADYPDTECHMAMERSDGWKGVLETTRELRNFRLYLNPKHPSPQIGIRRREKFPKLLRPLARSEFGKRVIASKWVGSVLQWVENIAPSDQKIRDWLDQEKPDIVVALTNISSRVPSTDYIKAANHLGIPTVISIASWDNLTTKGAFLVLPDTVFVWNQVLVDEAVQLHQVPEDRLLKTGAPTFDYWFENRPDKSRREFCEQAGLDPKKKYLVYLCSSRTITGDETGFVKTFAENMLKNPATSDINILVRPHPVGGSDWDDFSFPNVVIWPKLGDIPDQPSSQQDYFNTLHYAEAVVGVNTSAMVEAAIVDKPCVTILTEQYRHTQTGRGHFYHLLNGEYMEVAESFEESVRLIDKILDGNDCRSENRKKFVHSFIRPNGLKKNVCDLFIESINMVSRGMPASQIEAALLSKKV